MSKSIESLDDVIYALLDKRLFMIVHNELLEDA